MPKLSLKANPTFKAKAFIPVAGGEEVAVEVTFKHRTRDEFADWLKTILDKKRVDVVMECAVAWELDDPFSESSVKELDQQYMGAANAIAETYLREISGERRKN